MYKFNVLMKQNVPIPPHGEENFIQIPRWGVPVRKNSFLTWGILAGPALYHIPNAVSRKNTMA